jgi:hypothetical protein
VPNVIESTGNIESICDASALVVGDTVRLVFRALDDSQPPYTIRVTGPGGKVLLERVLRELPTGKPQSAPAVTFTAGGAGQYKIEVWELYGTARGWATLNVEDIATP